MPNNLSGSKIEDTYQQVLHLGEASGSISGSRYVYNGTGSREVKLDVTASYATTASYVESASYASLASSAVSSSYPDWGRVDQSVTDQGNISGSIVFDMILNHSKADLTDDVTAIAFTNNPTTSSYVTSVISVTQDPTTPRAMNWSGSGVFAGEGVVVADLEPSQVLSSVTQYWLYWAGHLGYWTVSKEEISANPL